ncbi:MAG TPA: molybdenum cofactor guanylyltransferase [Humisphaera sp.]
MSSTLAILAGGRGSRMGVPKDRLFVGDRPILVHLLERARWAGPTLLVASRDRPEPVGFERFDRVTFDAETGQGPLAGIAAALAACATPTVVVMSVDMPNVGAEQIEWLTAELDARPGAAGVMCRRRGDEGDEQIEPFPAIFRAEALPLVAAELAAGRRSLHGLLRLPRFLAADVPAGWPKSTWLNCNRPDDLAAAGAELR